MGKILGRDVSELAHDDIKELQQKIDGFHSGTIPEDKFKAFRLTRGVYGQRQLGVQMFRIKIPLGRLTADQLIRIADVAEEYTPGNLHLTTRQDIQLHYVKLDDSPKIWADLEEKQITAREACGNTVRNITASANAGIDPDEPFDVSPYVEQTAQFFLRNPICQDMGRKIKIAFSSSEADTAFTYFHDFGLIPQIKEIEGEKILGFKIKIGGGLGAQAIVARTAFEFLPAEEIIPYMAAAIRVFDRYGERSKRFKARMKFLIKELGVEKFQELVAAEQQGLELESYPFHFEEELVRPEFNKELVKEYLEDEEGFKLWKSANVFEQKQAGWMAVQLRVRKGDISAAQAREFARIVKKYAADDIRITVNQGLLLRFVRPEYLRSLYTELIPLGLGLPGFDSIIDITACPGTDTCNLAVTNSTGLAKVLEDYIWEHFPSLIDDPQFKIKISGCMNACGQHMAAALGLHGSSIKVGARVVPAMQIVLAGGVAPNGEGFIGEKVIKVPTKRIPQAFHLILEDYLQGSDKEESFHHYVKRKGKRYFYGFLKPLANTETLENEEFEDWNRSGEFIPEIGVGECAGVTFDVIGSIIMEAEERMDWALKAQSHQSYGDAVYHAYSAMVIGAKALLLADDIQCNTHIGIIRQFDEHYVAKDKLSIGRGFETEVLEMNKQRPDESFSLNYLNKAKDFLIKVRKIRAAQLAASGEKVVVDNYYKA